MEYKELDGNAENVYPRFKELVQMNFRQLELDFPAAAKAMEGSEYKKALDEKVAYAIASGKIHMYQIV